MGDGKKEKVDGICGTLDDTERRQGRIVHGNQIEKQERKTI